MACWKLCWPDCPQQTGDGDDDDDDDDDDDHDDDDDDDHDDDIDDAEAHCVCYLAGQQTLTTYDVLEDVLAHVAVHGRQRVVQQVGVRVTVHGTGQAHALLLTSAHVDALP